MPLAQPVVDGCLVKHRRLNARCGCKMTPKPKSTGVVKLTDLACGQSLIDSSKRSKSLGPLDTLNGAAAKRALGASARLCGTSTLVQPNQISTSIPVPRNVRAMLHAASGGVKLPSDKAFIDAYRTVAKSIPKGYTFVSVGASPETYAFMHECMGHPVIYVPFSRSGFTSRRTMRDKRRWARRMLRDAGVDLGVGAGADADVTAPRSSRNPRYAFVDFVFLGWTMALLGEVAPKGSVYVALTNRFNVFKHGTPYPWPGRVINVQGPIIDVGKSVRCIPSIDVKGAKVKLDKVDVAACNLKRLWVARVAKKARSA